MVLFTRTKKPGYVKNDVEEKPGFKEGYECAEKWHLVRYQWALDYITMLEKELDYCRNQCGKCDRKRDQSNND